MSYNERSLPLLIRKEEKVSNPINEKGMGFPTLDPNQTKIVQRYKQ
jgi:hypothetical protein